VVPDVGRKSQVLGWCRLRLTPPIRELPPVTRRRPPYGAVWPLCYARGSTLDNHSCRSNGYTHGISRSFPNGATAWHSRPLTILARLIQSHDDQQVMTQATCGSSLSLFRWERWERWEQHTLG
jgi:hypothetical protein